ncbi:ABC transporter substrate-binding protein [Rhodoligotrophos defluvii]|uniref:ABC transporter substrate-binding protein n=1 Tax=Rhodoligotrophos defluvii TaxID=2561934 RepID=UPI0010C9D579|nr:ABC transporter substrate-binding protein [Rhodoligotrophos defluvii]
MKIARRSLFLGALMLSALSPALAQETIKVGGLATLEGPFTVMGEDGLRGVRLALDEVNNEVAGKKIELITASSDASPDSALKAARKLVEQDGVQILIGPLSGSEGIAVKDYAKSHPNVTFINGSSAAQDTTLFDPAENFFRFSTDGVQWMAGLGEYVFKEKGFRKVAVVAEDYSFPYSQVQGFMVPFCKLGGKVPEKFWVPIGNKDYSSVIAALPDDVDAIFVALGGADAVNFLSQYQQAGGEAPIIGGSITVDQTVLGSKGKIREAIIGTSAAGPTADTWDDPRWTEFVAAYKKANPDGFPFPSLFAHAYYVNTKAALLALKEVNGDLSDGGKKFREALSKLKFDTPTGPVSIDENRNGIASIFITEVVEGEDGNLVNKVVKVAENVNQTLGEPQAEFVKNGPPSRDNPDCK